MHPKGSESSRDSLKDNFNYFEVSFKVLLDLKSQLKESFKESLKEG